MNYLRALLVFFTLISSSCFPEFVPYTSGEEIAPAPLSEFDVGRGYFLAPNERRPQEAADILAGADPGMFISVGTERGFVEASIGKDVSHLLLVDNNRDVVLFNRLNAALIGVAKDLDDYIHLRFASSATEWVARSRGRGKALYKDLLRHPHAWDWWKAMVRENKHLSEFHGTRNQYENGWFEGVSYLREQDRFKKLKKLASSGKIQAEFVELASEPDVSKLAEGIRKCGLPVGAVDISNAWANGVPHHRVPRLLRQLGAVVHDNALLVITGFRWSDIRESTHPQEDWFYSGYRFAGFQREPDSAKWKFGQLLFSGKWPPRELWGTIDHEPVSCSASVSNLAARSRKK